MRMKISDVSTVCGIPSPVSRLFAYAVYLSLTPRKKLFPVLNVLRMRADLIHQSVSLAVFLFCPIGDLVDEAHQLLRIGRRLLLKVILHL